MRTTLISRRTGFLGALTLAGALALAACSSSPEPVPTVDPGSLGEASGEFTAWIAIDGSQREAFETYIIGAFKEDYPNITPKISYRTLDRVDQQIQTALAAGEGPDLVVTGGPFTMASYVDAGYLLPLDAYSDANDWGDTLLPWAMESGVVADTLYAIPTSYETLVMYYNKTLFDERGITIPETRAEFEALAADLQADGIIPITSGNAEFQYVSQWWASSLTNHGAGPDNTYAALTGQKSFADPEFVQAATDVNAWFQNGWVQNSPEQYFTTQFGTMYDQLASGKAAMFLSGSWEFPTLNEYFDAAGTEYGWFPVPQWNDGATYPLYEVGIGSTYSISAKSANPDAVAAFLNWLITDTDAMMANVVATDASPMPVRLDADDFPTDLNPLVADHYRAISDATEQGNFGYLVWTFWPPQTAEFMSTGFDQMISGSITPQQYQQQQAELFDQELAAGAVPTPIARTP